jgi:hypothetical protein
MINIIQWKVSHKSGTIELSKNITQAMGELSTGAIDHILVKGLPISKKLPPTPKTIKNISNKIGAESRMLQAIANKIGATSDKWIENTIRFIWDDGLTNTETRHAHFQHRYSLLYCLRGDKNAHTLLAQAKTIITQADTQMREALTTPYQYLHNVEKFSLIEKNDNGYWFSPYIFDRSDLEEMVKDLDLPDVLKMFHKIKKEAIEHKAKNTINYLTKQLENSDRIIYEAGDLMVVNEQTTIRFSPSYKPSNEPGEERWLLATSIQK